MLMARCHNWSRKLARSLRNTRRQYVEDGEELLSLMVHEDSYLRPNFVKVFILRRQLGLEEKKHARLVNLTYRLFSRLKKVSVQYSSFKDLQHRY